MSAWARMPGHLTTRVGRWPKDRTTASESLKSELARNDTWNVGRGPRPVSIQKA